jgi:uncharacterized protein YndB with AHSA1/START domain
MLELLETMPELQEDERTTVSDRVFNAPRKMVYAAFADPLFERLTQFLAQKGVTA